jgi:ribosomal protein S7
MPEGGHIPPSRRIANALGRIIAAAHQAEQDEAMADRMEVLAAEIEALATDA